MDRKALRDLSYGLYIVSSRNNDKINGQIANSVFQITSDPVTVGASIHKNNLTNEYIRESGFFTVSVLSVEADLKFIARFGFRSGRDFVKFQDVKYINTPGNIPAVVENSVAWLDFKVIDMKDIGTHTLFIGEMIDSSVIRDDIDPMTYEYYHRVIKGKSPKNAPTFNI